MNSLIFLVVLVVVQQTATAPESQSSLSRATNRFANNLYKEVSKEPGNVLVCPLSLNVALSLLLQGAQDQTAEELAIVLGSIGANEQSQGAYKSLLTSLQSDALKIATKLYPALNFHLKGDFVTISQQYFFSDVEGIDYSNPSQAANDINQWVEKKTNNKIHDLISSSDIGDDTRLIIVNAVHFNAKWKKSFDKAFDSDFRVSPEEKVKTKMMSQTNYFLYNENNVLDAQVLKLEYQYEGYSMLFVLPNEEDGLPALEAKLVQTGLQTLTEGLQTTRVAVTIPKFKLEKTINLNGILKEMGIMEIFSSNANLNGITEENISVSKVLQKTFIDVHEEGTEASAATAVFMVANSPRIEDSPEVFLADRPFFFQLIKDMEVLFTGRFIRPE